MSERHTGQEKKLRKYFELHIDEVKKVSDNILNTNEWNRYQQYIKLHWDNNKDELINYLRNEAIGHSLITQITKYIDCDTFIELTYNIILIKKIKN